MNKKQKYLALIFLAILIIIAGFVLLPKNTASTAETQEIDRFVAQAGINNIGGWATYPNCGEAGGIKDGYLLQINNLEISQKEASKLKSLATSKGYAVNLREDGYEIDHNNWNIIVLDKNRADLFLTIQYSGMPNGFPRGGSTCS